jgi:hypothetical protein
MLSCQRNVLSLSEVSECRFKDLAREAQVLRDLINRTEVHSHAAEEELFYRRRQELGPAHSKNRPASQLQPNRPRGSLAPTGDV